MLQAISLQKAYVKMAYNVASLFFVYLKLKEYFSIFSTSKLVVVSSVEGMHVMSPIVCS